MKKPIHTIEIVEIAGRVFHIIPSSPDWKHTSWTFREEVDGQLIKPTDIMGCHTPKNFVAHHIRACLGV